MFVVCLDQTDFPVRVHREVTSCSHSGLHGPIHFELHDLLLVSLEAGLLIMLDLRRVVQLMHPKQLCLSNLVLLIFGLLQLHLQFAQHVLGLYVANIILQQHGLQLGVLLYLVVSLHSWLLLLLHQSEQRSVIVLLVGAACTTPLSPEHLFARSLR